VHQSYSIDLFWFI